MPTRAREIDEPSSDAVQEICECGRPILYACTSKCENCWAADQERWHGHDQSVKLKGST